MTEAKTQEEYDAFMENVRYKADLIDGLVRTAYAAKKINLDTADKDACIFNSFDLRPLLAMAIGLMDERNPELVEAMTKVVPDPVQ